MLLLYYRVLKEASRSSRKLLEIEYSSGFENLEKQFYTTIASNSNYNFIIKILNDIDDDIVNSRKIYLPRYTFQTLPYLMQKISPAFALPLCSFKVERHKESTARVAIWRQLGVSRYCIRLLPIYLPSRSIRLHLNSCSISFLSDFAQKLHDGEQFLRMRPGIAGGFASGHETLEGYRPGFLSGPVNDEGLYRELESRQVGWEMNNLGVTKFEGNLIGRRRSYNDHIM